MMRSQILNPQDLTIPQLEIPIAHSLGCPPRHGHDVTSPISGRASSISTYLQNGSAPSCYPHSGVQAM